MAFLGIIKLGDSLTFFAQTSTPATGAETDADAVPSYRIYEEETAVPILTGNMALLDDANTVGWYSKQIAVTVGNGFEAGKTYAIRKRALMATVPGSEFDTFQVTTRDMDDLAQPGDEMDLVNAPNATAITAIQAGLAVPGDIPAMITAQEVRDAGKLAPTAGAPAAGSLDAHLDDIQTDTGNLIARLGAFLGTTTNTVYGWLRAMMRKDIAVPSDIGGTFDPATDSEEGIRDAIPAMADIVDGVLDEAIAAHLLVGSVGEAINAAGAAGDPWITPLPGAYAAGTAGYIIGNCVNKTGAKQCVYPVTDSTTGLPIEGVRVWVSTDAAGAHVIREEYTDAFGNATFWLDPGDYYFWRAHPSYTFAPPADPETVP